MRAAGRWISKYATYPVILDVVPDHDEQRRFDEAINSYARGALGSLVVVVPVLAAIGAPPWVTTGFLIVMIIVLTPIVLRRRRRRRTGGAS